MCVVFLEYSELASRFARSVRSAAFGEGVLFFAFLIEFNSGRRVTTGTHRGCVVSASNFSVGVALSRDFPICHALRRFSAHLSIGIFSRSFFLECFSSAWNQKVRVYARPNFRILHHSDDGL